MPAVKTRPDPVLVVTASDDQYALPLAVMGRSLTDNLAEGRSLRLYVLDAGMRPASRRKVVASWDRDGLEVEWVRPSTSPLRGIPVTSRFGLVAYFRLLIPGILPPSARRAIYLDADTLVLDDVGKLWDTDLRGRPLGAVRDPCFPTVREVLLNCRELGISPRAPYFNSGVLLLDLDIWRAEDIAQEVIAYARGHEEHLRFADQDALNAVLATRWLELGARWNAVLNYIWEERRTATARDRKEYERVLEHPGILHFLAGPKPWQPDAFLHRRFLFFHYLDRTRWAGWRPPDAEEGEADGGPLRSSRPRWPRSSGSPRPARSRRSGRRRRP